MADASDSKSGVHYGRIGSTPITAIGKRLFGVVFCFTYREYPNGLLVAQKFTQVKILMLKN